MASPNTSPAIDAAERVLLAHAEEIAAACTMAHPETIVGVVLGDGDDAVHVHHGARGILPAIAAYEGLSTLILDPQRCRTQTDIRAHIHRWADQRRGLLQGEEWRVIRPADGLDSDPDSPAG